jgi:hypothetical protein
MRHHQCVPPTEVTSGTLDQTGPTANVLSRFVGPPPCGDWSSLSKNWGCACERQSDVNMRVFETTTRREGRK